MSSRNLRLHGNLVSNLAVVDEDALEALSISSRDALANMSVVPWSLVLLLLDWASAEPEQAQELQDFMPAWVHASDREVLLEIVSAFHLPTPNALELFIRPSGIPGRAGYRLRSDWRQDHRPFDGSVEVDEGLLRVEGEYRRMTFGQHSALAWLNEERSLGNDAQDDQLALLGLRSQVPPSDAGVRFDKSLTYVRTVAVPALEPRLASVGAGKHQVRGHTDTVPDIELDNYMYGHRPSEIGKRPLEFRDPSTGQKTKAVFTEEARSSFEQIRNLNVIDERQVAKALSEPDAFFGPALDTSSFSERVTGLGPLVRRSFPILKEVQKQDWWDWDVHLESESIPDGEAGNEDSPPAQKQSLAKDPELRKRYEEAIAQADRDGASYIPDPSGDGSFLQVDEALRTAVQMATELADAAERDGGQLKRPPKQVLQVAENVEALRFARSEAERPTRPKTELPPPPGLDPRFSLKPHQQEGYSWLANLFGTGDHAEAWRGGLLADDMGLGKTLQVLSFMSWGLDNQWPGPHLVVAPVALLENWRKEARRFFGDRLEPILRIGPGSLPEDTDDAVSALQASRLVLVSYESLRRKELIFARVPWGLVVLDEAQKAKDPSTQVSRVVRTLKARARLAMTGTPVENGLSELWCLVDWALPGHLGTLRSFADEYIKPLQKGLEDQQAAALAERLQAQIEPVFLRRLKQKVLADLPNLHLHRMESLLSAEQTDRYSKIVSSKIHPLTKLGHLFALCAHPRLENSHIDLPDTEVAPFPKASRLFEILSKIWEKREKVLIFANRRPVQHWLAEEVHRRFGVNVDVINGQINDSVKRLKKVDEFSNRPGFQALVLAPRAAGVGLNITVANHVIHYMREWNPAVENQATDRAYRIGQERDVNVYTIVSTSQHGQTVEEKLDSHLTQKRRLMDQFVVPMGAMAVSEQDLLGDEDPGRWAAKEGASTEVPTPPTDKGPVAPSVKPRSKLPELPPLGKEDTQLLERARSTIEDAKALDAVEILIRATCRMRITDFGQHMHVPHFQVGGLVAKLSETLNRDGYPVLRTEHGAEEVVLDREKFIQVFELRP